MFVEVRVGDVEQVLDEFIAVEIALEFQNGDTKVFSDVTTRHLNEGNTRVQQDAGRTQVLLEVELRGCVPWGVPPSQSTTMFSPISGARRRAAATFVGAPMATT